MWLAVAWAVFGAAFLWNHLRVRARRDPKPENRVHRASASDWGLLLQAVSFGIAFLFPVSNRGSWDFLAAAIAGAAIGIAFAALTHLGREWRLQAVVTDDHRLITTGPYSWVRHPVYLALLGMLLATVIARTAPLPAIAAIAVFLAGTGIRIRAEDRILGVAFPNTFPEYRRSVSALIPKLY